MTLNVKAINRFLSTNNYEYEYLGKDEIDIIGFSSIFNIQANKISWIKDKSFYNENILVENNNIVLVINKRIEFKIDYLQDNGLIVCNNPKEIFFAILNEFYPPERYGSYISPFAAVDTSLLGVNTYVGHYSHIGRGVKVGNNVIIKHNVSIEGNVEIGDNTIIHSGVRIGTDGFGYYQDDAGKNIKVPHYGGVIIGKNVEIGANTCIDKGTLDDTIIEDNVKIDNLCQIAHNCVIKKNSSITGMVALGGSVKLETNSYIAPGSVIKNQLTVGTNSMVGIGSVVIKNVKDGKIVFGVPARITGKKE